jgi:hypothetical protein
MIFPTMALMIPALVPIVLIEGFSLSRSLKLPFGSMSATAAITNIISTVVGIPVTWFLLVSLQLMTGGGSAYGTETIWKKIFAVTFQAPWLMPYEKEGYWIGNAAMLTLLVPFFFASWKIEYWVSRKQIARDIYARHESRSDSDAPDAKMKELLLEGYLPEINVAWRNANLFSYGLLAMFLIILLVTGLLRGR